MNNKNKTRTIAAAIASMHEERRGVPTIIDADGVKRELVDENGNRVELAVPSGLGFPEIPAPIGLREECATDRFREAVRTAAREFGRELSDIHDTVDPHGFIEIAKGKIPVVEDGVSGVVAKRALRSADVDLVESFRAGVQDARMGAMGITRRKDDLSVIRTDSKGRFMMLMDTDADGTTWLTRLRETEDGSWVSELRGKI